MINKNRSSWQVWCHEWCQEDYSYVATLSLLQPTTETLTKLVRFTLVEKSTKFRKSHILWLSVFFGNRFFGEQLFWLLQSFRAFLLATVEFCALLSNRSSADFVFLSTFVLCFQGWRSLFELHFARLYRVLLLYLKFRKKSRAKVLRGCFLLLAAQFRLLEKSRFLQRIEFQKQRWDCRELWQDCCEFVGRLKGVLIRDLKAF